jgi:hypothetical protein
MLNEHWRTRNNRFGLYTIDHRAIGWDKIDQIISNYYKVHKVELEQQEKENKQTLATRRNRFSSNGKMRLAASLPVGLLRVLEKCEPNLFKDKKLFHSFIKKFNKFKVCQEV